ncbi:hypothetical protein HMPREF1861_00348 [Corynebacterium kroppenstedtii]|nr:hypothetical protein HMPREF1861_00348 [Corynebacterium kroppenstedtii]
MPCLSSAPGTLKRWDGSALGSTHDSWFLTVTGHHSNWPRAVLRNMTDQNE